MILEIKNVILGKNKLIRLWQIKQEIHTNITSK